MASQYRLDAYRNVPRIRWITQVCTVASGNTAFAESGKPLSPSQTRKNTSRTPVDHLVLQVGQHAQPELGRLPGAVAGPQPEHVPAALQVHSNRGVERPVADLPVQDLDVADDRIASMNTAA